MMRCVLCLVLFIAQVWAIPIDNGVEGDPEIECGPDAITINFNTQQTFEGHVYVKGLYAEPGCRENKVGRRVAGIRLPFSTCNVQRERSLNPRGVFVTTTVVITFHPQFITKVDRAYKIQCFYMEADKTVDTNLEVSMLTTGLQQTQNVPMPVCRYDLLSEGPTGEPVQFAVVGDKVFHKWTCVTETQDTFCMLVHSCYVDDTSGEKVDIIDSDGCAVDKFILNNLEYNVGGSDLMVGQEAHVFKYADRSSLYFQCQITVSIKEPNGVCPQPSCSPAETRAIAPGSGDRPAVQLSSPRSSERTPLAFRSFRQRVSGRRKRQAVSDMDNLGTMDVVTDTLSVIDVDQNDSAGQFSHLLSSGSVSVRTSGDGICLSHMGFGMLLASFSLIFVVAISIGAAFLINKSSRK